MILPPVGAENAAPKPKWATILCIAPPHLPTTAAAFFFFFVFGFGREGLIEASGTYKIRCAPLQINFLSLRFPPTQVPSSPQPLTTSLNYPRKIPTIFFKIQRSQVLYWDSKTFRPFFRNNFFDQSPLAAPTKSPRIFFLLPHHLLRYF